MVLATSKLREARRSRGLTQEEAARFFGCGLRTYKGWELDGVVPRNFWLPLIRSFTAHARKPAKSGAA